MTGITTQHHNLKDHGITLDGTDLETVPLHSMRIESTDQMCIIYLNYLDNDFPGAIKEISILMPLYKVKQLLPLFINTL